MTTIPSFSSRVTPVPLVTQVKDLDSVSALPEDATPASTMAVSPDGLKSMQAPLTNTVAWDSKSSDPISSLMTINYAAASSAGRLRGIGAALLHRFESDPSDFSQSVSQPSLAGAAGAGHAYQFTLDIMTASGIKVSVALQTTANGLRVQVTSAGTLGDAERGALSGLADAFQKAIDGIGNSAKLDLGGLLRYDASLLSSVDLNATVQLEGGKTQTLAFHADSKVRSLRTNGPDGSVDVSVDLSRLAALGDDQQRKAGMDAYLQQADDAASRGHANTALLATFKNAFTQMVGEPSTNMAQKMAPRDLALLTGLADFSASFSETPTTRNAVRPEEIDMFSYQVSQNTDIGGQSQFNRSIRQTQEKHLKASFHEPLHGNQPFSMADSMKSQSYYFRKIIEDTVSDTDISYSSGELVRAGSEQHTSGSMTVAKYVMGILSESSETPLDTSTKRDLMKQALAPMPGMEAH